MIAVLSINSSMSFLDKALNTTMAPVSLSSSKGHPVSSAASLFTNLRGKRVDPRRESSSEDLRADEDEALRSDVRTGGAEALRSDVRMDGADDRGSIGRTLGAEDGP